jgi:integrase
MARNRKLTDRALKAIGKRNLPGAGKTRDVDDGVVPGLKARVMPSGEISFVLVARYPGSRNPTRRSLGLYGELTLNEGREKARRWRELLRKGIDPAEQEERERLAEQRKQANTFAAAAADFINDKLIHERQGREAERDLRVFLPACGARPLEEITPADVLAIIRVVKNRGAPYRAHGLLTIARRFFNWCISQQTYGLQTSPCDRLKPRALIGEKKARTRVLSDTEWRGLWAATEKLGYPYGPLIRLLAITGQRKSEVAEARWSEIDLAKKVWVIPAARMKADAARVVPLSDAAIKVLETLPRFERGDCLFSATFGATPVNGFGRAKSALDRAMKVEHPFVLHDLRRTMRTGLSAIPGISDLVRELVIGHTKPGLHKVYDQFAYLDEKRRALDFWAARLLAIVGPPPDNVVAIPTAAVRS